jgi:hypothetical protein
MLKFQKKNKVVMEMSDNGSLTLHETDDWKGPQLDEGGEILSDPSTGAAITTGPFDYATEDKLRSFIMSAGNGDYLAHSAFFSVGPGWRGNPKELLKYPHHAINDTGKMVLHKAGLKKATKDLMKAEPDNAMAINHAKQHHRDMGMTWKDSYEEEE